jgi:hypothetical protein
VQLSSFFDGFMLPQSGQDALQTMNLAEVAPEKSRQARQPA